MPPHIKGAQYGNGGPLSQSTSLMTGGLNNHGQHGRIRESSSGALVGKNIAGVGSIGKSSSNLLKEDRISKANMLSSDTKKFTTHAYDDKKN